MSPPRTSPVPRERFYPPFRSTVPLKESPPPGEVRRRALHRGGHGRSEHALGGRVRERREVEEGLVGPERAVEALAGVEEELFFGGCELGEVDGVRLEVDLGGGGG